jgi:hypothetical protein
LNYRGQLLLHIVGRRCRLLSECQLAEQSIRLASFLQFSGDTVLELNEPAWGTDFETTSRRRSDEKLPHLKRSGPRMTGSCSRREARQRSSSSLDASNTSHSSIGRMWVLRRIMLQILPSEGPHSMGALSPNPGRRLQSDTDSEDEEIADDRFS